MIYPHGQGKPVPAEPGVTRTVLAHGGTLMIVEFHFDKGVGANLHSHPHEQIGYCVRGHVRLTLNGEIREVFPGDSFYVAPNVVHGVEALEESVMLDSFTPQRESFL